MKTGLVTTVTNGINRKKYFVSTTESIGGWQTAVFHKKFGLLANFWKPEFFLGGSSTDRASDQHDRTVAIVRDIDPANWNEASRKLAVKVIEEWSTDQQAQDDAFYEELQGLFKTNDRE